MGGAGNGVDDDGASDEELGVGELETGTLLGSEGGFEEDEGVGGDGF